jgi:hypothetical protein
MFSTFSVSFKTVYAVQMVAALTFVATHIMILFLHIIACHGSAKRPTYLLFIAFIFITVSIFIMVATHHDLLSSSEVKSAVAVSTYLHNAFFAQWTISILRRNDKVRYGTEPRSMTCLSSGTVILSVTILVAAIGSYFAQQYMGMCLQYPVEKILFWGTSVISLCPITMMIVAQYSYRGLTPKEEINKKPFSERLWSLGILIVMIIACEIHGVVLLFYPPTNWKDMFSILGVGFVIGAVYYQVNAPYVPHLQEPIYEHLTSEKLPLTVGDNH